MKPILTEEDEKIVRILSEHRGRKNAIKMRELYETLTGESLEDEHVISRTRKLRTTINRLKWVHGVPIMSGVSGYFLVQEASELTECCGFFRRRAMTELYNESVLKKISLAEVMGQLVLDAEMFKMPYEDVKPEIAETEIPGRYIVITRLLDEIQKDPRRYEEELEALRKRYGALFISRGKLREINETAKRLAQLTEAV